MSEESVERVSQYFLCSQKKSVLHASREFEMSTMTLKDKVFVPPLPASIPAATVETITPDMLIKVWQQLDYRLDVCRVITHRTLVGYVL
jgi:hypothetical protein